MISLRVRCSVRTCATSISTLARSKRALPLTELMPNEKFKHGDRIKAYITKVENTTKGPQIMLSRTHPGLLKRLFELEVPEIFDGVVEIRSVAREAGFRSKNCGVFPQR
ncbi:transcription elongation factor NusA [Actinobacillus pleuropneumoniae]|nr:transcription elongation factor NusA [Actinobacillus pleuropneumoniae]